MTLAFLCFFIYRCSTATIKPQSPDSKNTSEIEFQFKKGLWPDSYYLVIDNPTANKTVEFYGCDPVSSNFYAEMNDGSTEPFDSDVFCQIGYKGRYWVHPQGHGAIPFKIHSNLQDAKQIVFKGVTYLEQMEDHYVHQEDTRELMITYDVLQKKISSAVGAKIEPKPFPGLLRRDEDNNYRLMDSPLMKEAL